MLISGYKVDPLLVLARFLDKSLPPLARGCPSERELVMQPSQFEVRTSSYHDGERRLLVPHVLHKLHAPSQNV